MRSHMKTSGPAGVSRQRLVRYLGASGYRRFTPRRAGAASGNAKVWLLILAVGTALLALLGAWQEGRTGTARLPVPPVSFDSPLK